MKEKLTLIALNNALNSLEVEKEELTKDDKIEVLDILGVILDKLSKVDAEHGEKLKEASKAVCSILITLRGEHE